MRGTKVATPFKHPTFSIQTSASYMRIHINKQANLLNELKHLSEYLLEMSEQSSRVSRLSWAEFKRVNNENDH